MTVNQRLDRFLTEKKISQSELARLLNVSRSNVNNWFNEKCEKVSPKKILEIIELFTDLNARWLITGDGEMMDDQKMTPTEDELMDFGGTLLERLLEERGKTGALENEVEHLKAEIIRLKKKCGESDQQRIRAG